MNARWSDLFGIDPNFTPATDDEGRLAGLQFAEGVLVVAPTAFADGQDWLECALTVIREEQARVRRGES